MRRRLCALAGTRTSQALPAPLPRAVQAWLPNPESKIRFEFDGEVLQPGQTPADVDMACGEAIDAFFMG